MNRVGSTTVIEAEIDNWFWSNADGTCNRIVASICILNQQAYLVITCLLEGMYRVLNGRCIAATRA